MKKLLAIALCSLATMSWAQDTNTRLEGFEYGVMNNPDGSEWQSPERLSLNKL